MKADFRVLKFILLFFLVLLTSCYLLSMGSYELSFMNLFQSPQNSIERLVFWEIRFPRLVTAILGAALLAFSGLFMQSYFQNPIVGPYVLGIQSGASFGVALFLLMGLSFSGGIVLAATLGAIATLTMIILCSNYLKQKVMLLILGLLVGQLLSGAVSLLALFAGAQQLKSFIIWGLGSFDRVGVEDLKLFVTIAIPLLVVSLLFIKPLNLLVLGDDYAKSLGLNLASNKLAMLILSGLMTALVTAYCGPIAFIGLIVPHLGRAFFQTHDHRILLPGTFLIAALVGVSVQVLSLSFPPHQLPINTVLGCLSAPVLLFFILSRKGSAHVLS